MIEYLNNNYIKLKIECNYVYKESNIEQILLEHNFDNKKIIANYFNGLRNNIRRHPSCRNLHS